KHIVRSVAVIALGRFRVPQPRDFSVIGFKISLGNPLVAAPALAHHVQPESVLVGAMDGMSRVAIVANRQFLAGRVHALGMDAVLELFLDAVVTLAARSWHIGWADARLRIVSGQNVVSGMATGAGRRH